MKTEQLKAKILDLLIKGELTAKWRESHKDIENAEILLEKIRSEKEKKLNDELIAKGKKPTAKVEIKEVEDNDKPFEIPESWKWVHLSDIADIKGGKRIPAGRKLTNENTGYKYIRVTDMKNGSVNLETIKYIPLDIVPLIKNYRISKDDIYITCAGTIGEVGLIPEELDNANLTENADKLVLQIVDKMWLYLFLSTALIKGQIAKAITTLAQPKLAIQRIQDFILPLPPLEEQKELARIAQNLLAMVDEVDSSYTNLEDLSKKAKSKVLDLLIKGVLTAKWRESHKDIENAEILLEKIRSEKVKKLNDELIAKGKKPTAKVEIKEVADNDKPFEIPESWKWCHVGDVFAHNTGKTLNKDEAKEGELLDYITTSNLYWWHFDFTKIKQMLFKQNEIEKYSVKKGDLLVCEGGDVGRTAIWENDYSVCYQNHIHRLRPHIQGINVYFFSYIFYVFKLAGKFDSAAKGIGIKGLASNALDSMLIPLPPLEEQKELARIAQILLNQIDSLTDINSTLNGEEENE